MFKRFIHTVRDTLKSHGGVRADKKWFLPVIVLVVVIALSAYAIVSVGKDSDVRIGYFLGGRTSLLYRAYINNYFTDENVSVRLITKTLREDEYYDIPDKFEVVKSIKGVAKATGMELLDEVVAGRAEGATPGESSFVEAVWLGMPIVAVAELGHDTKEKPGHAIIFRKDVRIEKPEDIKGKKLVSRRAGAGDAIFLLEFLRSIGLDKDDVSMTEQVDDDHYQEGIVDGTFDGGYFHLVQLDDLVDNGYAYIYRKLDWVNPELSHALLVFHKDFVRDHPDEVEKVIRAYMKRIKFEHSLSKEERMIDPGKNLRSGLQMEKDFHGMNIPQYDLPPLVSIDLLNEVQDLMLRYNYIDKKTDLSPYIDNSFVEKIYREGL